VPDQADADHAVLEGLVRLMHTMADHPELDELGIVQKLVDSGVDRGSANRLIVFAPIAFGRLVLDHFGVRSNEMYYRLMDDETVTGPFPLLDVAEFRVAVEHMDHLRAVRGCKELAAWSADVHGINEALHRGADVERLVMQPLVTWWDGD
jgi:hypothetical protein